jgi:hypothetical protein
MMRARHEEDEPVEGEVFGLDDDEEGAVDDEDVPQDPEGDAQPPAIHLHFHNNVPSNPVATASSPASTRRKRTLRFQDDPDREHTPAPATPAGPDHLGDKYGTPFKRSSTRLGKQAKHAFEDGREGDDGPAGMLFGHGDGGRRLSGEVELDL